MSDTRRLLIDAAERLFAEHCDKGVIEGAERGEWPNALWQAIEEADFAAALVPENAGGSGIAIADALAILGVAGRSCAPVPLAETMLANWLFAQSGLGAQTGPLTVAPVRTADRLTIERQGRNWRLTGRSTRVPWARHASSIAVLAVASGEPLLVALRGEDIRHSPGKNIAGEARDDLDLDVTVADDRVAKAPGGIGPDRLFVFGAAMRTIQIAGALSHVLDITVQYAQERVQFGRPIGKFQAIQQYLAVLASHAAAAGAAADLAAEAAESGLSPFVIGAAKARASEAASVGAAIAHQVHGAIGFTKEHMLNHHTRRLWSWRDEFGTEAYWNRLVGEAAAKAGPEGLWAAITAAA
jgi:acyl-CoA dehydrogenase